MEKPDLKELQALAENMEKGVGFKPPLDYLEKDGEKLLQNIITNAADLDPNLDREVITAASKKTLKKLGIGPWLNEKPEADKEPEKEKEKPAAKQEATPPSQEKPAKPEKPKQEKEKGMKKQETKAKAEKKAPKKNGEGKKGPGVIETILDIIIKQGPVTKQQIHKQLVKMFPDRKAESMMNTINVQIPGRIQKEKKIVLVEVEGKGWKKK